MTNTIPEGLSAENRAPRDGVEADVAADTDDNHDAPYTDTFWSIAEAVTWREGRTIDISVARFAAELKRRGFRIAPREAARTSSRPAEGEFRPTHRHVKRGTEYEVIGEGVIQALEALHDDDRVVIYRGNDGQLWVREPKEFNDGRFEALANPQPQPEQKSGRAQDHASAASGEWVLVPREPTEAMIEAYCAKFHELGFMGWVNASTIWPVMLAAAPKPPESGR